jgi:hypothetical protein
MLFNIYHLKNERKIKLNICNNIYFYNKEISLKTIKFLIINIAKQSNNNK